MFGCRHGFRILIRYKPIHGGVTESHRQDDQRSRNNRRACCGNVKVAASGSDHETQYQSNKDFQGSVLLSVINAHTVAMAPPTNKGTVSEKRSSAAPAAAPASMETTPAQRRRQRGLLSPARVESAAKPAIVRVNTVVVRSATPSFRTIAVRRPIAIAIEATTALSIATFKENAAATKSNTASASRPLILDWRGVRRRPILPPTTAPSIKQKSAITDFVREIPDAPPSLNPIRTMLPVMLAANICPSPR